MAASCYRCGGSGWVIGVAEALDGRTETAEYLCQACTWTFETAMRLNVWKEALEFLENEKTNADFLLNPLLSELLTFNIEEARFHINSLTMRMEEAG